MDSKILASAILTQLWDWYGKWC